MRNWEKLLLKLKEIAKEKGITQEVIAEKTGHKQSHISRMFSLEHSPRLDILLAVADVLGVELVIKHNK
jgi:DNA-binding phage protein